MILLWVWAIWATGAAIGFWWAGKNGYLFEDFEIILTTIGVLLWPAVILWLVVLIPKNVLRR